MLYSPILLLFPLFILPFKYFKIPSFIILFLFREPSLANLFRVVLLVTNSLVFFQLRMS